MKNSSSKATDPIDLEPAIERFLGDRQFFRDILGEFLELSDGELASLAESLQRGDTDTFKRSAHTIKGTAATLEAAAVRDTALTLEKMDIAARSEDALQLIEILKTEIGRLREFYDRFSVD